MKNLLASILVAAVSTATAAEAPQDFGGIFGRGINLGNALEAPAEGEWGVTLREEYFAAIKDAGFQHVRIPVRWSAHAALESPYTIDPKFLARVDWAIAQATDRGLAVVLNMHHYDEIFEDPDAERDRFLGIWGQLATHYHNAPATLALEPLNEPHKKLTNERWNELSAAAITLIRKSNPTRFIVVGPGGYNNFQQLPHFKIPAGDSNIVATFHYYDPFHFTHQGAAWVGEQSKEWLGKTWSGTDAEKADVRKAFDAASAWAKEHGVAMYLGEFGAYGKADIESRVAWTRFIAEECRQRGMASAYWEFCSGFGAYDPKANEWRKPLLEALGGR